MEEASALANKVGILAKKMLGKFLSPCYTFFRALLNGRVAVGTTNDLVERYATYEVHFSCRSREEVTRAQELMAQIPGARMADDVATRFEVPIGSDMTLADLFAVLSRGSFTEYTVERATLESVFLKVIRENKVAEEDSQKSGRWLRMC